MVTTGSPAAILCTCAASAEMTVLGCRGRDGLPGLPLGSVSLKVAAHAPGRVVVVRGHWRPVPGQAPGHRRRLRRITWVAGRGEVGVRGGSASRPCVVSVCALADTPGLLGGTDQIRAEFEHVMSAQPRGHPEVVVNQRVREGAARTALLEAARDAQLLVLGARGRGGLPGMPLGSASVTLLSHAACPVAIVHADD